MRVCACWCVCHAHVLIDDFEKDGDGLRFQRFAVMLDFIRQIHALIRLRPLAL